MKNNTTNLLKAFTISLLLLLAIGTRAQIEQEKSKEPNVIPPPPTEGALGKYGNYPVSMYTGLPSISIPLFEVKDKNLSLPMTLSYHASGIKVDEIASWVGLGWSLNAGGVISRTVVGSPDERPDAGYWTMAKSMKDPNVFLDLAQSYTPAINILYEASQGIKDFEPDMFTFNFMGYSGSLLVDPFDNENDNIRECQIYPHANISIYYINGIFKAVDYNGVEYFFDATNGLITENKTKVNNGNETITRTLSHISTWLLTRIYDPNSHAEIRLTYVPITEKYDYTKSFSIGKSTSDGVNFEKKVRTLSMGISSSHYLDSIICKNEFIKITREVNRQDLPEGSGCSLQTIEKGRIGDPRKVKYSFGYGYFSNGSVSDINDIYRTHRLRLDNISLTGENGEFGGNYTFNYNNDLLPERGSFQQDYWGYFNNKPNTTPIPPINYGDQGADLNPDATGYYMKANTLQAINYPTGGSTEFIYEPHDYSNDNGTEIPLTTTILNSIPHTYTLSGTHRELELNPYVYELVLPTDMNVEFNCNYDKEYYSVGITKDGVTVPFGYVQIQNLFLAQGVYRVELGVARLVSELDPLPERAELKITYFTESSNTEAVKAWPSGGLRIKEIKNTSEEGKHSIKRYSYLLGSNPSRSSGVRSDFKIKYSCTENELYLQDIGSLSNYAVRSWDMRFGRNQYNYALTSGSSVGYREVKESELDLDANGIETSNGYTVSKFISCVDIRDGSYGTITTVGGENTSGQYTYPSNTNIDVIKDDADYLRGRITSKVVYNANQFPVKEEVFTYTPPTTSYLIPGLRSSSNNFDVFDPDIPFLEQHCKLTFTRYFRTIQKSVLSSKKESLYVGLSSDNKQTYSVNTTNYNYNSHQQIISEKITPMSLPASALETKTYYPDMATQIPTGLPGLDDNLLNLMEEKNMLAIPVFSEQFKGDMCINRTVNQFYNNNGSILLKGKHSFDFRDGQYYNNVLFNHSEGNIIDAYKDGDINEAYYWGYNRRYPIVKATNVSYGALSSAIDAALGSLSTPMNSMDALLYSIATPNDARWIEFNKLLRSNNNLAGCLINTYTYDPIFGITSQTSPNGLTTYYEYDGLGRLAIVRDHQRSVLKSLTYHYKGYKPKVKTTVIGQGNIYPQNPEVEMYGSVSLSIEPATGHQVKQLKVNGSTQNAALNYEFHNITYDQTLEATFEIKTYTVSFDSQGGTPISSITANHGSLITKPTSPIRAGHTFDNWYKDAACTIPWNFANDAVTSNLTLHAKWFIENYDVIFNSQGGSAVAGIRTVYNTKINAPDAPVHPDFTFSGWFKEPGCINPWDFNNDLIVTNTTLYAKWMCTVTFLSMGGTSVSPKIVERNTKVSEPIAPTQPYQDFWGWYKESGGYNIWNFNNDIVTKNTSLYARWNPQICTLTINKTGNGTVKRGSNPDSPEDITPIEVNCNSDVSLRFYPAVGYSVRVDGIAWNTNDVYTVQVNGNITLNVEFYITPPPAAYLYVSPTSLNFGIDEDSKTLEITSNVNWTITYPGGVNGPSSGSNNATITVNCIILGGSYPKISITGGGITRTIPVTKVYE